MTEQQIYDFLQGLMPELQWLNPYLDKTPVPPPKTDWAVMHLLPVKDKGWSQSRQLGFNEESYTVDVAHDVQRIYRVAFDFYGLHAWDNASTFKQWLHWGLRQKHTLLDLKTIGDIQNLSFLQENKSFMRRYHFEAELFGVDTIHTSSPVIQSAVVKIVNRGNNF